MPGMPRVKPKSASTTSRRSTAPSPRRQLRFVLAWAELHQEELSENWRRARAGETLMEIEPLR
jgi:hypothetical protein